MLQQIVVFRINEFYWKEAQASFTISETHVQAILKSWKCYNKSLSNGKWK